MEVATLLSCEWPHVIADEEPFAAMHSWHVAQQPGPCRHWGAPAVLQGPSSKHVASLRRAARHAAQRSARAVASQSSGKPQDWTQVLSWCRSQFSLEVKKPDAGISLAIACCWPSRRTLPSSCTLSCRRCCSSRPASGALPRKLHQQLCNARGPMTQVARACEVHMVQAPHHGCRCDLEPDSH